MPLQNRNICTPPSNLLPWTIFWCSASSKPQLLRKTYKMTYNLSWFILYQWRTENGWLVTLCDTFTPHIFHTFALRVTFFILLPHMWLLPPCDIFHTFAPRDIFHTFAPHVTFFIFLPQMRHVSYICPTCDFCLTCNFFHTSAPQEAFFIHLPHTWLFPHVRRFSYFCPTCHPRYWCHW